MQAPTPHLSVPAMPTQGTDYRLNVGLCLRHAETGKIFVAERKGWKGQFQMPQGGVDTGEEALTALTREVWEETTLQEGTDYTLHKAMPHWLCYDFPPNIKPRPDIPVDYKGQCQLWFLGTYTGDGHIDVTQAHDDEFMSHRWVTPEEAIAGIVLFKREVYQAVLDYFCENPTK